MFNIFIKYKSIIVNKDLIRNYTFFSLEEKRRRRHRNQMVSLRVMILRLSINHMEKMVGKRMVEKKKMMMM